GGIGSGWHLRRGAGVPGLRELAWSTQLAPSDELQFAVEPLPPCGQGGEGGLWRIRLVGRGVRGQDARCPGTARAAGGARTVDRAGKLPRLSPPVGDGGDRRN